jgi:hypothetical protein
MLSWKPVGSSKVVKPGGWWAGFSGNPVVMSGEANDDSDSPRTALRNIRIRLTDYAMSLHQKACDLTALVAVFIGIRSSPSITNRIFRAFLNPNRLTVQYQSTSKIYQIGYG